MMTNLLFQGSFLDVDGYGEDRMGPAALSVHLGLRGLPLLAAALQDAVHLRLAVYLHFL